MGVVGVVLLGYCCITFGCCYLVNVDLRCGVYVVVDWKLLWGLIVGRIVVVVNSSWLVAGYCGSLGCCCLMVGECFGLLVVVVGLGVYNMLELCALFCCTLCM